MVTASFSSFPYKKEGYFVTLFYSERIKESERERERERDYQSSPVVEKDTAR